MTLDEIETHLRTLLDRQAILDVISLYTRGVDRLDREAILSAYHADALDDHGCFVGNREEFSNYVTNMHRTHHHATMHFVGNTSIEIDGQTAHVESYYLFFGVNKVGPPITFVGGRYLDRMEKRNGRWAIVQRKCLTDWTSPSINDRAASKTPEGRANFLHMASHEREATKHGAWPRRDRTDPRYERPLSIDPARIAEWQELLSKHTAVAADNSTDLPKES